PDDDPIAGQPADLYFDTQDQLEQTGDMVTVTIRDDSGREAIVPATVSGTLATARYTFPAQGVYDLVFTVSKDGNSDIFKQSQRVSRGVVVSALDEPAKTWPQGLLLASAVAFLALMIVAFN